MVPDPAVKIEMRERLSDHKSYRAWGPINPPEVADTTWGLGWPTSYDLALLLLEGMFYKRAHPSAVKALHHTAH